MAPTIGRSRFVPAGRKNEALSQCAPGEGRMSCSHRRHGDPVHRKSNLRVLETFHVTRYLPLGENRSISTAPAPCSSAQSRSPSSPCNSNVSSTPPRNASSANSWAVGTRAPRPELWLYARPSYVDKTCSSCRRTGGPTSSAPDDMDGGSRALSEVQVQLCSKCRNITAIPPIMLGEGAPPSEEFRETRIEDLSTRGHAATTALPATAGDLRAVGQHL